LENVVHFALLVAKSGYIEPSDLRVTGGWDLDDSASGRSPAVGAVTETSAAVYGSSEDGLSVISRQLQRLCHGPANRPLFQELEELVVREAFSFCRNNQVHTAALLGISRNVMRTLLKRYGYLPDGSNNAHAADERDDEDAESYHVEHAVSSY